MAATSASHGDSAVELLNPALMARASISQNMYSGHSVSDAIPSTWKAQAEKAWEYYREEPLVANCVNSWRVLAIGDEIQVTSDDEAIALAAEEVLWGLGLNDFVKDMVLQLLVKGECVGYRVADPTHGFRVTCVNPVSMTYERDEAGRIIKAEQKSKGKTVALRVEDLFLLKWNAPEYEEHGTPMPLPAFAAIELLREYRRADRAIAKRWAAPLRLIQVGGNFNGKLIIPDQHMIDDIGALLSGADFRHGIVVPFFVKAETYGVDGAQLETDGKMKAAKEDILVAMGMSQSLVTGDGPNFATASVSGQKMVEMLKEVKQAARKMLDWVFDYWLHIRGSDRWVSYQFSELDLSTEADQKRLLVELYDRGLISKETLQKRMGLVPEIETGQRESEGPGAKRTVTAQDIVQLIAMEAITVEEGRSMLGLGVKTAQAEATAAQRDVERSVYGKVDRG